MSADIPEQPLILQRIKEHQAEIAVLEKKAEERYTAGVQDGKVSFRKEVFISLLIDVVLLI